MKAKLKLLIPCIILSCTITSNIKSDLLGSLKGAVNKVGDIGKKVLHGVEGAAGKLKEGVEIAGQKFKSCAEMGALGTGWVAEKSGLTVAQKAVNSVKSGVDAGAFDNAKKTLQAAKDSSKLTLNIANALAKQGLDKTFNIKCIRFLGTINSLKFELTANIVGKEVKLSEEFKFSTVEDFGKRLFEILKQKFK